MMARREETLFSGERGCLREMAMVRLDDEGVPIRALARVFVTPFDEVEQLLREARDDGRLIELPGPDWPVGTKRDARLPTVAPVRGDAPEIFVMALRGAFGLTPSLGVMLAALVWRGRCTKARLLETLETGASPKIVDVFICKLRRALAPYQLGIETVWGWGYAIDDEGRAAIAERIRSEAPAIGRLTFEPADAAVAP